MIKAKAELKKGNKKQATLLMKRKKMYEKEISKLEGMSMFLEQQKLNMESNMNNKNVFDTMKHAGEQIEKLQDEGNIEQFDEIVEKHREQQDKQDEITDFFKDFAEEQGEDEEDIL